MAAKKTPVEKDGRRIVASNRRARHDYDILDTFECGFVLHGSEVKSLRNGEAQISDAYADFKNGELWLSSLHIGPYSYARDGGHIAERTRKLLLHRRELVRLEATLKETGLTLVPLSIYFVHGLAKVELALVRGRRKVDKRNAIKEREQKREMDRGMNSRRSSQ